MSRIALRTRSRPGVSLGLSHRFSGCTQKRGYRRARLSLVDRGIAGLDIVGNLHFPASPK